jgi:hypothetical protein
MTDSEKGSLEREIFDIFERATKADPTVHGLAQGRLTPDDLKALDVNDREAVNALTARLFGATRKSLDRLAREIDAINSASDGGD